MTLSCIAPAGVVEHVWSTQHEAGQERMSITCRRCEWPRALGVKRLREQYNANYFTLLACESDAASPPVSLHSPRHRSQAHAFLDIDKDVQRTLPRLKVFQQDSKMQRSLRVILRAYARFDHALGYCQSLNTIAAIVLLELNQHDETCEKAQENIASTELCFWTYAAFVRRHKPYYARSMCGLLVDRLVLDDLLALHEPIIQAHLRRHDVHAWTFCASWFLCVFVDSPLATSDALRVWDTWLIHTAIDDTNGADHILFHVALALFALNRSKILSLTSSTDLLDFFLHHIGASHSIDAILEAVYERLRCASLRDDVHRLREFHRHDAVVNSQTLSGGIVKRLECETGIYSARIRALWRHFLSSASTTWQVLVDGGLTSIAQLHRALIPVIFHDSENSSWQEHGLLSGVLQRLMLVLQERYHERVEHFDRGVGVGTLTFEAFVNAVSVFCDSDKRGRRLELSFRFCDLSQNGRITKTDLKQVMDMFSVMHTGQRHSAVETELFCEIAFQKVHGSLSDGLNLHQFRDIVVLHPQLLNFFCLDDVLSGGIDLHFDDDDDDIGAVELAALTI